MSRQCLLGLFECLLKRQKRGLLFVSKILLKRLQKSKGAMCQSLEGDRGEKEKQWPYRVGEADEQGIVSQSRMEAGADGEKRMRWGGWAGGLAQSPGRLSLLLGFYCVLSAVCVLSRSSHVRLFTTPWTVACQAPLSVGFPRQEYWSGLLCPSLGHLLDRRIEPESLMSRIGGRVLYH